MSYNYTQFVASLANLAGTTVTNQFFVLELPSAIDYAEQRIFRDLDLIATVVVDNSRSCTPNNRNINLPGAFIVLSDISVITPAGAGPGAGTRNPLVPCTQAFLDLCYPNTQFTGVPRFYNYQTQGFGQPPLGDNIIVGPFPDAPYLVSATGTQRPAPLSATNPVTFLTTYVPDLFLIAAMIHMAAYQKNWAATGNDPASGVTWETQYAVLLNSVNTEQMRVRYSGTPIDIPHGFVPSTGAPAR